MPEEFSPGKPAIFKFGGVQKLCFIENLIRTNDGGDKVYKVRMPCSDLQSSLIKYLSGWNKTKRTFACHENFLQGL